MNFLITILNIAIFQGIVLGAVILASPLFKSKANNYLAYAIFSISISLLNYVLDVIGSYQTFPILSVIDVVDSSFLFPTFIFIYVVHQVEHPIQNTSKTKWVFLPYLYSLIHSSLDTLTETIPQQFSPAIQWSIELMGLVKLLIIILFIPSILSYTYRIIKHTVNTQERKWLTSLWLLAAILFGSWILAILAGLFFDYDFSPTIQALTLIVAFLMHWISYFGIFKFRLAKDQEGIRALIAKRKHEGTPERVSAPAPIPNQDEKKNESFTADNAYFQQLETLCLHEHIYRDSSLDRDKVAVHLAISPGYVSQLINSITGENFSTYINRHRVEAVKQLILDPEFDHYSLLAIGMECGFSSKTTFYNAFKKLTGVTPNTYRKTHKE